MIEVLAEYEVAPEHSEAAVELLNRHAVASQEEPGCLRFDVYRSTTDPARLILIETYTDEAAFEAHRCTEHFRRNIEQTLVPWLLSRQWTRYERLRDEASAPKEAN